MALYFPKAEKSNGSNADMCSDVAGPLISGSGDFICLTFQKDHRSRTFIISPTISTTSRHLGFERHYNYHTAFRACYVVMDKVY